MPRVSEEISRYNASSSAKTDSNLANDALHLGGIKAEEYAAKKYVQEYHENKEETLKKYIDEQDEKTLATAKSYTDSVVENQDFSGFAKVTDVKVLDDKLSDEINSQATNQKNYTDTQISAVVKDTNDNFDDIGKSIASLNETTNNLFTSVSDGKNKIASAITDKGIGTESNASFDTMASNIRNIKTENPIDPSFVNTSDATATSDDIVSGKTAYANGSKIYGSHICSGIDTNDATATPYDILSGKTAYANGGKITGVLQVDENNIPSFGIGVPEPIYATSTGDYTIYNLSGGFINDKTYYSHKTILYDTEYNNPEFLFAFKSTIDYSFNCKELHVWKITKQNQNYVLGNEQIFNLSVLGITNNQEGTTSSSYNIIAIGASPLRINKPFLAVAVYKDNKNCELNILPIEIVEEDVGNNQIIRKVQFNNANLKHHTITCPTNTSFSPSYYSRGTEIQISDDGCYFAFADGNFRDRENYACVLIIVGYIYTSTFDISVAVNAVRGGCSNNGFNTIQFINNNLLAVQVTGSSGPSLRLILFTKNDLGITILATQSIGYYLGILTDDLYCITRPSASTASFRLRKINVNYEQSTIDVVDVKDFTIMNQSEELSINASLSGGKRGIIIPGNLLLYYDSMIPNLIFEVYKININADDVLTFQNKETVTQTAEGCSLIRGNSFFYFGTYAVELGKNFSEIIGLIYNGDYYYKQGTNPDQEETVEV